MSRVAKIIIKENIRLNEGWEKIVRFVLRQNHSLKKHN